MDQIFGYIERITFQNTENGFTVARLKQPRKNELTTIVGKLPQLHPGESVRLLGSWKTNPTHGIQFDVAECEIEEPSDVVGIQKYLESGMIKGIGPIYAKRIVKRFGEKTLEVIDQHPNRLSNIEGIGKKRLEQIKRCWGEHKAIREVMIFLQKNGVTPAYAQKVFKVYGEETVERLQENPYTLALHIPGIGFKSADTIASRMGFPKDGTARIDAGIDYVLSELSAQGHTCYPKEEFVEKAEQMLEVSLEERLKAALNEDRVIEREGMIYSKKLWIAERGVESQVKRLLQGQSLIRDVKTDKAIEWVEEQLDISLAEAQKQAVITSLTEKFHIITGGPGTGKSTITNAILTITERLTGNIILAAPTGRAAKRMNEITKRPASTIHLLLQYDFKRGRFKKDLQDPLSTDLIIVDEASMIDTTLMYHLLKAIPSHARVIFVGDVNQLPSVGPGSVLNDLIESKKIGTTRLTKIYRQAKHSRIITNAHLINAGEFPELSTDKESDFFFIKAEEPEEVVQKIVHLVCKRLRGKFHPFDEIQVLAPMKRGGCGIDLLNRTLQEKLNPQKEELLSSGTRFCVGDKVMQIRNNYTKEVFNGDIGRLVKIDRENQEVLIKYEEKIVSYTIHELDEVVLAYATSIHKYQGSEAPCVIIPVHPSHFMMLKRNLLYTGVTRGKKLVILVGTGKAIGMAVSQDDAKKRHTGLFTSEALHSSLP
ncbi:MAG: ATP-dependent RecD-like DNA helicase [Chlamydiales bacterium]|nr:ATP-dependent RecD-like DNA helicase [Chlamydiales bacterium]MCH9619094.1 ATP-dependent RecD-like DNA helicase [Chlamydiales bacterium]MCH9622356.1 ATP-dependent RecD-like DNA helicase [Chlamydiales bacterium]